MISTHHFGAQVLRFRPRGAGRFGGAVFLSVWLCGWAVGEAFALAVLGGGVYSLVTGRAVMGAERPVEIGPAVGIGCFLLFWLALWTLGGVLAIRQLLHSVWAQDRLAPDREGLVRARRLGPLRFVRRLARTDIQRIYVQSFGARPGALMADLGNGTTMLTDLGTPEERVDAVARLSAALGLPADTSAPQAGLTESWQQIIGPRGKPVLVPNLRTRRREAVVVAALALVAWSAVVLLALGSLRHPGQWAITAMVAVAAAWLARQALWLHRGRKEWRIEPGRLVLQRRVGNAVTELREARALELVEVSGGDGDTAYELNAIELATPPGAPRGRARRGDVVIQIERALHDPTEPRRLGLWLSQQAGVPLHDRVPDQASRQAEICRLRDQLAGSGKFGRLAARLLDRRIPPTQKR